MHLPFLNVSSQPDLEIIIPGRPERLLNQLWHNFCSFSRSHQAQIIFIILLGIATVSLTFTFTLLASNNLAVAFTHQTTSSISQDFTENPSTPNTPSDNPPASKAPFINLQPTVNRWASSIKANVGLMIYDLDHNQIAAQLNPHQVFSTASIYKLFFAYVGYQDIDSGYTNPNQPFAITNDYRANTYTFAECLDLMLRESYNGCADPVRSNQRLYRRVESLISELQLTHTTDGGLYSTPADLTVFLKYLYLHHDLSTESWTSFQDSMLTQPPTQVNEEDIYDWRQGLPAGFSDAVKVYDKVGWSWSKDHWSIYNDAAIVEFPDLNRHYIIVLLTTDLHENPPLSLQKLSTELEAAIRNS